MYSRSKAKEYAVTWAFSRNLNYYNFDTLGGDCTNFVSQCLFAGCNTMNFTKDTGWYYNSLGDRAAAWTGVEFLYTFLTNNRRFGPYGTQLPLENALIGDIIQLSFDGEVYSHSLFVVDTKPQILIAAHTYDSLYRPLFTYSYEKSRLIHIEGSRNEDS